MKKNLQMHVQWYFRYGVALRKCDDGLMLLLNVIGIMCAVVSVQWVWFYKHTNLYVHANDKCAPCITSWVNLYIGRKYDVT